MLPRSFAHSLVVAEDEDSHQERRQGDGVANSVNDVEPFEDALQWEHKLSGKLWKTGSDSQQADKTQSQRVVRTSCSILCSEVK